MPSGAPADFPKPQWLWAPPRKDTFGPEVAEVATLAGFTPDPPQRDALDLVFAVDGRGRAAARDVGVCAPRQNIKTGLLKQCALGWLYVLELPLIVWSAHERDTSLEAFRDMEQLITSTPDLDREVLAIHRGKGDESIELRGNRRLKFKARTRDGGRGLTGNRIVLDEAMKLSPDTMAALVPTLRAVPDPQLVFAGSAGTDADYADIWRGLRRRGRVGGDPSLAWVEWGDRNPWACADPRCLHMFGVEGCALDDERRWWATNTALTAGRITVENLRADRKLLPPIKFATETLGWWIDPPPDDDSTAMFPKWSKRRAPEDAPADRGRIAFGVDVSWDRSTAWVASACELADGTIRAELIAQGPGDAWVGAWLFGDEPEGATAAVGGRYGLHKPVAVGMQAEGAPVSSLLAGLRTARPKLVKAKPELLRGFTAGDMARSAGKLYDLVDSGGVAIVKDADLDRAARRSLAKPMGDAWVIDRKASLAQGAERGVDASPLVALTVAVWLLASTGTRKADPVGQIW